MKFNKENNVGKQNEKLLNNIKKMEMKKNEISAKDECIKICETIWSCKNAQQKDGVYNMFETYKRKHGDENVGVTFIQIELARLEHIIRIQTERAEQMKAAQERQVEAQRQADMANPPQPTGIDGKVVPINKTKPNQSGTHGSMLTDKKLVYDKEKKKTNIVPKNS